MMMTMTTLPAHILLPHFDFFLEGLRPGTVLRVPVFVQHYLWIFTSVSSHSGTGFTWKLELSDTLVVDSFRVQIVRHPGMRVQCVFASYAGM